MDQQVIIDIFDSIQIETAVLLFKLMLAFLIFLLIKNQIQRIVGYLTFKSNPYVSLGKKVRANNLEGVIKDITFSFVVIETDYSYYLIDTSRWKWHEWVFYKEEQKKIKQEKSYEQKSSRTNTRGS